MVEKQKFNIIMISTYPPKECGIATYAKNLFLALNKVNPKVNISILAIDELKNKYSQEVKRIIEKEKINSYCEAANYINNSEANLVYIQHEFGIFGKHDGKLLIQLLKNLKVPIVMSLHTVPITKEAKRRKSRIELFKKFSKYCRKIILTTSLAKKTLIAEIGISKNRLKVIYHGTPQVKYITQNKIKDKLKLNNKKVLSSIGLINSNKGINLVVEALPDIIKEHKDVVYLIVGTIHPVKKKEVDEYLKKVTIRARELKVDRYIKRIDEYLTEKELISYFQVSDIYLTPYKGATQVSSGTLAYAIACGRCVVSTPYIYAQEMIGNNLRGFLVNFNDPKGIAKKINYILDHPNIQKEIEKKAYKFGQKTTWKKIAEQHLKIFKEVLKNK